MSNRQLFGIPGGLRSRPVPVVRRSPFWAMVRRALRRYRSRQYLGQLDAHMLKDIGVTPAEAEAEANKPFWRS
jgi:uncharacterized protein YjiS (DUF1127 family)